MPDDQEPRECWTCGKEYGLDNYMGVTLCGGCARADMSRGSLPTKEQVDKYHAACNAPAASPENT